MFDWKPIGEKNWAGEYTYFAAQIPNACYGENDCVVINPSGGAVIALLTQAYVQKLHCGKVALHVQYKNRSLGVKFIKSGLPEERVKQIAEEFCKNYQPEV